MALLLAACSRAPVDPAASYRAAYIECECAAQRDAVSGPTMAARVEKRAAVLQACLAGRGHGAGAGDAR